MSPGSRGTSGAVVLTIGDGRITAEAPAGWADRAALRALAPDIARACAPPLPPVETWPESWCDAWWEREAIAAGSGAPDPAAVATADLRVAVWRGELEAPDSRDRDGWGGHGAV